MQSDEIDFTNLKTAIESFSALIADADEHSTETASSAVIILSSIADDPAATEIISYYAREAAATSEAFISGECGFQDFHDEMCGWADMMQKEIDSLLEAADVENEGQSAAAAGSNASANYPEAAFSLDSPDTPEVPDELSSEDAEEFDMQLEVIESLIDSFNKNNCHIISAMVNILYKIAAIPTAGKTTRESAESCIETLRRTESGDESFESGTIKFKECLKFLRKQYLASCPAGTGSAPAAVEAVALENYAEKCLVILEEFESAVLDAEAGESGAVKKAAAILAELVKSSESDSDPIAGSLIGGLLSVVRNPSFAPGPDGFSALLAAKDILHEYFRSNSSTGRASIIKEQADEIFAALNISSTSFAAGTSSAAAHSLEIPVVRIDPDNPELLEFVTETKEYIQSAESSLIVLEKDPASSEHLNEIFRCFHNIKGISGFLELKDVQMLAHDAESLMDKARNGEIRFAGIYATLAYEALDTLKEMIDAVKDAMSGEEYKIPTGFAEVVCRLRDPEAAEEQSVASAPVLSISEAAPGAISSGNGNGNGKNNILSHDSMVKLSTVRLDSLIDMVGELVIANAMVSQDQKRRARERRDREMTQRIAHLDKITRELQEMAMSLRMVSLQSTFQKMTRIARDTSHKMGIPVEFTISGGDTEIDRNMVEEISSPLVHMVRNAIDHGIERPEERRSAGKPEKGNVHLSAFHESGNVVIRIEDDGKGLDRDAILKKAETMGLARPGVEMSDEEIYSFIFHPGFSTAKQVTDISGRGVGMDVVRKTIETLRGRIEIKSGRGKGSSFTIRLPLTLAIIDGMVVSIGRENYILPTIAIQESLRPKPAQLSTVASRGEMILLRNNLIPLFRLHRLFDIEDAKTEPCEAMSIVVGEGNSRCALMVDKLLGQQQVVIKTLGRVFEGVEGISGGAIMGDGKVALILDTPGLARLATGDVAN